MRALVFAVILAAAMGLGPRTRAAEDPPARVTDFFEQNCTGCHTGRRAKGGVDLTNVALSSWSKVRAQLLRRTMPPDLEDRPPQADYDRVLAWLDEAHPAVRGRITMRRLNRVEYQNTIRDLLGVDFFTADRFPQDDVGHGFDNIGDVLTMPPILLEKYLAAAEVIAGRAIVDLDPKDPVSQRVTGAQLRREGQGRIFGTGHILFTGGLLSASFRFPRDGEYILRARAFGQQAGPDPVRLAFQLDRRRIKTIAVPNTTAATFELRTRVKRGRRLFGMAFVNDFYNPRDPNPLNRDRNAGVVWLEVVGPIGKRALPKMQRNAPRKFGDFVREFASRAFRRPVTDAETMRIRKAVNAAVSDKASYEQRMRLAVTAILVSPHFLFRVEPQGDRPLNDYELATRLSYFLWASMPDEELFALAARGALRTNLKEQVGRMLRDARASSLADNFATQWLQISRIDRVTPDPRQFPGVGRELLSDMATETTMLFDAILREQRSVWELLDADFTFLNERLAKHYGVSGVRGPHMRRVRRKGGVLAHASVLTVTSNPTRTSPVKRGKWILESLLDAPPRPPPPGLDGLKDDGRIIEGLTFRKRLEQHRADPKCSVCHEQMDVLGFGLENYDAVGRWRERDAGVRIDASGTLPDGRRFDGPAGLRTMLAADRAFLRSLSKHLLTYALGRGLGDADERDVQRLVKTLERTPTLQRLAQAIVTLEVFQTR